MDKINTLLVKKLRLIANGGHQKKNADKKLQKMTMNQRFYTI